MPAARSVVSAVLQKQFGHPDRAASAREHERQARELHKLALRELHTWAGSAATGEGWLLQRSGSSRTPGGLILAG
jgi:hypothetical protein